MNKFFHLFLVAAIALITACAPVFAADLSITATNVVPSANAWIQEATSGTALTSGQLVYLDTTDVDSKGLPKLKLSDCNSGTAAARVVDGIVIGSVGSGVPVKYVIYDPALQIAASGLTVNNILISSATAGGIAPSADLTTGWYLTVIGVVKSGTTIYFRAPGLISGAAS